MNAITYCKVITWVVDVQVNKYKFLEFKARVDGPSRVDGPPSRVDGLWIGWQFDCLNVVLDGCRDAF